MWSFLWSFHNAEQHKNRIYGENVQVAYLYTILVPKSLNDKKMNKISVLIGKCCKLDH